MWRGAVQSATLHASAVVVAWLGLPHIFGKSVPEDNVIIVEMVEISEQRNLPDQAVEPSHQAEAGSERNPVAPAEPKPAEAAPPLPATAAARPAAEPAPEPPPEPQSEPERIASLQPEAVPLPQPQAAPERPQQPTPKPAQVAQLPPDVSRPKRKPRAPARFDFEKALESLTDEELPILPERREADDKRPGAEHVIDELLAAADQTFRTDASLSMTEIDNIRSQIERNWNVPAGAQDAQSMAVTLRIRLGPDGTITSVELAKRDLERTRLDPFFRTMAESAVRAVNRTRRIENLSPEKYPLWRDITMKFDPQDMFG